MYLLNQLFIFEDKLKQKSLDIGKQFKSYEFRMIFTTQTGDYICCVLKIVDKFKPNLSFRNYQQLNMIGIWPSNFLYFL